MRQFFYISLALAGFAGCSAISNPFKKAEVEQCQAPLAYISTPEIHITENALNISAEEVQKALEKSLKNNCIALSPNTTGFDVIVSSQLDAHNQEGIASDDQSTTALVKVLFKIKRDRTTTQVGSTQKLNINAKKVLGIGSGAKVSHADRIDLLQRAMQDSYEQLLSTLR